MATTSISVRYRPLRIGFAVDRGDFPSLDRIAAINSLLWGGMQNSVLPIGEDAAQAEELLGLFNVDILTRVGEAAKVAAFLKAHQLLRTPSHFADDIFFEDWHTKRQSVGPLDIIHIIDHYWETEIRHNPPDFQSRCVLVQWAPDDPCAGVFAASFGHFDLPEPLRDDFRAAFEKGLRARSIAIENGGPVDAELNDLVPPLALTADRLEQFGESPFRDEGLYIGRVDDFDDLVNFWNLRAAGIRLRYLPYEHVDRFSTYIQHHLVGWPSFRLDLRAMNAGLPFITVASGKRTLGGSLRRSEWKGDLSIVPATPQA